MTRILLNRQPHNGRPPYVDPDGLGGQRAVIVDSLRHSITTGIFGRSAGKSPTPFWLALKEGAGDLPETEHIAGTVYAFAYGSPQFNISKPVYHAWKHALRHMTVKHYDADYMLRLRSWGNNTGAVLRFWSLDNYDSSRSFRLHRWVVDEFKDVHPDAVTRVLIPTGLGRHGKGTILGTPSRSGIGMDLVRTYFTLGRDPAFPRFASRTAPSHCNPFLTQAEIDDMIAGIFAEGRGEDAVREEIWAEILQTEGAVFGNLDASFVLPVHVQGKLALHDDQVTFDRSSPYPNLWIGELPRGPSGTTPGSRHSGGLDLARSDDATVLTLFDDDSKRMNAVLRLRDVPPPVQARLCAHVIRVYRHAAVRMDATGGHGEVVRTYLSGLFGESAEERVWTTNAKQEDISRTVSLIHTVGMPESFGPRILMLDIPWLRDEFKRYEGRFTDSKGRRFSTVQYGGPPGTHDDGVASVCLASGLIVSPRPRPAAPVVAAVGTLAWFEETAKRQAARPRASRRVGRR